MNTDYNLSFLKAKTESLGTALFYNFSRTLLKFPTSVIQLTKFDKDGNIWFQAQKPYKEISAMDRIFPAQLHFYKKECLCYAMFEGVATIEAEEMPETVTIKFKISKAECFYKNGKSSSFLINLKNSVSYFLKSIFRDEPNHLHFAF